MDLSSKAGFVAPDTDAFGNRRLVVDRFIINAGINIADHKVKRDPKICKKSSMGSRFLPSLTIVYRLQTLLDIKLLES